MKYIAEIGGNHHGSLFQAKLLIYHAKESGATHVKFQCFTPEQMVGDPDWVVPDGIWGGKNLLDLYRQIHTPREWFPPLFEHARGLGITPFASVFHRDDVDFLEGIGCDLYKISSLEVTDLGLIRHAHDTGKELIVSIGGLDTLEIFKLHRQLLWMCPGVTAMKCVSEYPAKANQINLLGGISLKWGLSDHTTGVGVAAAAVALGACAIEKHFTLDKAGPDKDFSLLPAEFKAMVTACHEAREATTGESFNEPSPFRRTWWWAKDLEPGDIVTPEDVKAARPGLGVALSESVVGSMIVGPVKACAPVQRVDYK